MKRILLLSDTHSHLDERILFHAKEADEIWHCGDFGSLKVLETLESIKPLRGVFGNIDGQEIRKICPEILHFECEAIKVMMTHIGGYPSKYTKRAEKEIKETHPQLFITGHSHILKVMFDPKYQLLHLNPGAAGKQGWHKVRTMLKFVIDDKDIKNLEIIESKK